MSSVLTLVLGLGTVAGGFVLALNAARTTEEKIQHSFLAVPG
jgi:hypothetical protein